MEEIPAKATKTCADGDELTGGFYNLRMPKKESTKNDLSYFGMKEREIPCPHCDTNLVLSSLMDTIFMAKKKPARNATRIL